MTMSSGVEDLPSSVSYTIIGAKSAQLLTTQLKIKIKIEMEFKLKEKKNRTSQNLGKDGELS